MKKPLLLLTFLITVYTASAQTYAEKAAGVQKLVWDAPPPEFKLTEVPAKYNNESAVVLAQSYSKQRSTNLKFRFMLWASSFSNKVTKLSTFHERVKINDKSALDNYSSLEYQKRLDKSHTILLSKYSNLHETFVGAKIIKAGGQEVLVNTGEEVLLKNTEKEQKGKLAIPGLQVGDILDYYISSSDIEEDSADDSYISNDQVFVLAGEFPILNYSLYFQFNKKASVFYIPANGAPKFEESVLENGDKVYKIALKDLPKFQSQKWTSAYRQLPYIEISHSPISRDESAGFEGAKKLFESYFNEATNPFSTSPKDKLMSYYDGKKKFKLVPPDSSMKVLYDIYKYQKFCSYYKADMGDMSKLNYRSMFAKSVTVDASRLLTDMDIPHEVLLVCSRESNSMDNVFTMGDFDAMIRLNNGSKPMYIYFDDAVTHFNEIPAKFQGEKYVALTPTRKNARRYEFAETTGVLPVVGANDNRIEETVQASMLPDMQKITVQRQVKQTGYLRHDDQKALLSAIDIDKGLQLLIDGAPLETRLSETPEIKKIKAAYITGMTKTDAELRKAFMDEAEGQYGQEPSAISDYKVMSKGLEINQPVFEFTSTVVLNNFVKKAGPGYIIDAGKLAGSFLQLEDKDRARTLDVYMPCARSFKYNITINLPAGFKATGVEELNKQVSNKTGSFTSTAEVKGNTLVIIATRSYNNNFEKAADWPLVTQIVDAAFAFNNQKILLEK